MVYNISQRTQTVKNRRKSLKLLTLFFCLLFDNAVSTINKHDNTRCHVTKTCMDYLEHVTVTSIIPLSFSRKTFMEMKRKR